jgi:hypothetical protein
MDGMMTSPGAHAKHRPVRPWLLTAIAVPAAVEIWACWMGLGSLCGFPVLRLGGWHFSTGFTLAVGMEAYGIYAMFTWLAPATGPRARAFAVKSAGGAFVLSLGGQVAYHLMLASRMAAAPPAVVVFAACLPVVVLAFAVVLTHLILADARAAAEASEIASLRAELDAVAPERDAARLAVAGAERRANEAAERADALTRKLAAVSARNARPKKAAAAGRARGAASPATGVPNDVDAQAEALAILAAEPDISGAKLGERVGKSERWGQLLKNRLAATAAASGGPDAGQETGP